MSEYLTVENIRAAVKSFEASSTRPVTATIGQYADYVNFSDMADIFVAWPCYCCGKESSWHGGIKQDKMNHCLCDGCHFRHTVMKAAGREEEFWASSSPKPSPIGELASEMSYRLAESVDAIIRATVDEGK